MRRRRIVALIGIIFACAVAFLLSRAVRVERASQVHVFGGVDDLAAFEAALPAKFEARELPLDAGTFQTPTPIEDHVADLIANREARDSAFAYVTVSSDPRDALRRLQRARAEIETLPAKERILAFSSIVPLFSIDMCQLRDDGGPYATAVEQLAIYSDGVFGAADPGSGPTSAWVLAPCTPEAGDRGG